MDLVPFALDAVAICVLTFGLYMPRHRRKDLAVALMGVNIGVLAVTATLATSTVGAGLGLGLFGVLSIIRLRSTELSQVEVAYYFAALAMALVGGLAGGNALMAAGLIGAIVVVLALVDSPRFLASSRQFTMVVDRAITDTGELARYIEAQTGVLVKAVIVTRVDYINDSTVVDVRCTVGSEDSRGAGEGQIQESVPTSGSAHTGSAHTGSIQPSHDSGFPLPPQPRVHDQTTPGIAR